MLTVFFRWIRMVRQRFGFDSRYSTLLIGLVVVSLLGVGVDVASNSKRGQIDLRNRLVGARAMISGHNPYTYKWKPGDPLTLLDPRMDPGPFSRVTVTPTVLAIQAGIAPLKYSVGKQIWYLFELALFGGLVAVTLLPARDSFSVRWILIVSLLFFCSYPWRIHVEYGQVYILYCFLAALSVFFFRKPAARPQVTSGVILGILVALRPHYALLGLVPLTYRRMTCVAGMAVGALIGFAGPALIRESVWLDYTHAMLHWVSPNEVPAAPVADQLPADLPANIEGIEDAKSVASFDGTGVNVCLSKVAQGYGVNIPSGLLFGAVLTGILVWTVEVIRLHKMGMPAPLCLIKTMGLVLFTEMILPTPRSLYSDVILLTILLCLISECGYPLAKRRLLLELGAIALVFSCAFLWIPRGFSGFVGEAAVVLLAVLVRSTDSNEIADKSALAEEVR